jgi:hypothetical protein
MLWWSSQPGYSTVDCRVVAEVSGKKAKVNTSQGLLYSYILFWIKIPSEEVHWQTENCFPELSRNLIKEQ